MLNLIAKSNICETIREHTDKLLKSFDELKMIYPHAFEGSLSDIVRIVCEYHDYGKAAFCFQKMISKKVGKSFFCNDKEIVSFYKRNGDIPHGFLSPSFISIKELKKTFSDDDITIIINAIFNHHIRKKISKKILFDAVTIDLVKRFPNMNPKTGYLNKVEKQFYDDSSWIKYALSIGILNRLDYHASSSLTTPFEIPSEINGLNAGAYLTKDFDSLRPVQMYMKAHQSENILLTASTGIGKTEAAMLWAGSGKLFYTLPLKVSINAIYERIKSKYDNVALLHSDTLSYLICSDEYDENSFNKLSSVFNASRLFSYPVSVCTVDQILSFVYKARGTEKLLASLSYSKIVIDEIQSYSPDIIAKIIYALCLIQQAGGKFAIMTATFNPIIRHFIKKVGLNFIENTFLTDSLRNSIFYKQNDDFDYDFIIEKSKDKKILIICNTVKASQHVYKKLMDNMDNSPDIHLVHSEFTRKDRRSLENEIINVKAPCIWVTTQIVEASLDIDFDILFTDICPADSLVQRMGRCYRRREYFSNEPNVYIYNLTDKIHNGKMKIYDEVILKRSVDYIEKYVGNFSERDKMKFVNDVYDIDSLSGSDFYKDIDSRIYELKNTLPDIYTADIAENQFRNIRSVPVIPDNIYNDNIDNIDSYIRIIQDETKSLYDRMLAEEKLFDLTISVNFDKYSKYIQSQTKVNNRFFYRIDGFTYDFDESSLKGLGLIRHETDSDDFFI